MGTRDAARRGQLRALCTHDANNVMLCYVNTATSSCIVSRIVVPKPCPWIYLRRLSIVPFDPSFQMRFSSERLAHVFGFEPRSDSSDSRL